MTPQPQTQPQAELLAPDVAIRATPPNPRRLSRKTLMAGALALGAIIAFALINGLSDRERSFEREEETDIVQTATPPESVRTAPADYAASDLAPPRDPDADFFWGDDGPPQERGEAPSAPPAAPEPSPGEREAETARVSAIGFSQRGAGLARRAPDPNVLDAPYRPPASPYLLQAGSTIAASLITALNSDRPGRVVAQVTENVYDAVRGEHLLIPQGARLIGVYDANNRYGDQRLIVTWTRLVFPNGYSITLGEMTGVDAAGAAGVRDRVDAHLGRIALASVVSGVLAVAANEAEGDDDARVTASVGDAAAQEAARVGGRIVDRELEVRPTIRVRAGARIRVLVHQDIVLRPYAR
jgi:type IV secretion system protein TrbI